MSISGEYAMPSNPVWLEELEHLQNAPGVDPVVAACEGHESIIPDEGYLIGATIQVGKPSGNMLIRRYTKPGLTIHPGGYEETLGWMSAQVGGNGPALTMMATGPGMHVPALARQAQEAGSAYSTFLELRDAFVTADAVDESGRRLAPLISDILGPDPEISVWAERFATKPDSPYFHLNRAATSVDEAVAVFRAIGQGMGFTGDKLERYTDDMKSHVRALQHTPDTQAVRRQSQAMRVLRGYTGRLIDHRP